MRRALVLAALAACHLDAGQFDDRACAVDGDCRPDERCTSGLCGQVACTTPADCGSRIAYDCVEHGCVATACASVDDCGTGLGCGPDGYCELVCEDGIDANGDGVCDTGDPCNAEIRYVAASTTAIPAGVMAGDLLVAFVAGRPTATADPPTPLGWRKRGASYGAGVAIVAYDRFYRDGDPPPAFALPAEWGVGATTITLAAWRNVDHASPFAAAADAASTTAASTTFAPTPVASEVADAWIVTAIATSTADASPALPAWPATAGFLARTSAPAFAVADRVLVAMGTPAMPTWTAAAATTWAGLAIALRPTTGHVCAPMPAITQLAIGARHTCALFADKTVRCWGDAASGQLGYGNTTPLHAIPADAVATGGDVQQIVAGAAHTCALLATGAVRCWGRNNVGQLCRGNTDTIGDDELPTGGAPTAIGTVIATQLAAGDTHTCALLDSGSVRCWGANNAGQDGYGTAAVAYCDNESVNAAVALGGKAVEIAAGGDHTCARLDTGKVRCWGANASGELGYGNTTVIGDNETAGAGGDLALGTDTIAQLALGGHHSCVRFATGDVRCWGANNFGQLGLGSTTTIGDDELPGTTNAMIGGAADLLAAGTNHTCVRLAGGALRCFGQAGGGQLGYGNVTTVGDAPATLPPLDVAAGRAAGVFATGFGHACAVLDDGALRCWGDNADGELGYGTTDAIGDDELPSAAGDVAIP